MHIYIQIHIHIYLIKWDRVYITPPKMEVWGHSKEILEETKTETQQGKCRGL